MILIYTLHFARFAGTLEAHLLKYRVACSDADMIIEENSVLYFEKLKSPMKKFLSDKEARTYEIVHRICI